VTNSPTPVSPTLCCKSTHPFNLLHNLPHFTIVYSLHGALSQIYGVSLAIFEKFNEMILDQTLYLLLCHSETN